MADAAALPAVVEALQTSVVPDNVTPPLASARYDTGLVYKNDCHVYYDSVAKTDCIFGDPNGSVTVALFGDSHAAQWFPASMVCRSAERVFEQRLLAFKHH